MITITIDEEQQNLIGIPDIASQSWVINNLDFSKRSLLRYRNLAIGYIPQYQKSSNDFWFYRYGEDFEVTRARLILNGGSDQRIDKPPFCKPQIEILLAVRKMFSFYSEKEIQNLQLKNNSFWKNYHAI